MAYKKLRFGKENEFRGVWLGKLRSSIYRTYVDNFGFE